MRMMPMQLKKVILTKLKPTQAIVSMLFASRFVDIESCQKRRNAIYANGQ